MIDDIIGDPESAFSDDLDVELPPTVDRAAVERMRAVAWLLDESVRVPGTDVRIGLDAVLGVVPGAGDVAAAGLSLYIVLESARLGVTYTTLVRMLANVAIDVAGGAVPYVGTVFDTVWKANSRNLRLALDDLLTGPGPGGDFDDGLDDDVVEIEID